MPPHPHQGETFSIIWCRGGNCVRCDVRPIHCAPYSASGPAAYRSASCHQQFTGNAKITQKLRRSCTGFMNEIAISWLKISENVFGNIPDGLLIVWISVSPALYTPTLPRCAQVELQWSRDIYSLRIRIKAERIKSAIAWTISSWSSSSWKPHESCWNCPAGW